MPLNLLLQGPLYGIELVHLIWICDGLNDIETLRPVDIFILQ